MHKIESGDIEILSLLFDSAWYLTTYQDVAQVGVNPLEHYLAFGYREGRNPNRFFNTNFYLETYPDLAECHLNPFIHYILYGASEGRLPRPMGHPPLEDNQLPFVQDKPEIIVEHQAVIEESPAPEPQVVAEELPPPSKPVKTLRKPASYTKITKKQSTAKIKK